MPQQSDQVNLRVMSAYELVALMDKSFPPRCILPNETPESAHRYAGRRELVDEFLSLLDTEASEDLQKDQGE